MDHHNVPQPSHLQIATLISSSEQSQSNLSPILATELITNSNNHYNSVHSPPPPPPPYSTSQHHQPQQPIPFGNAGHQNQHQQQICLAYQPNTKENHGAAYEWMVRNLHEASQRILNLETELQSRDVALTSLKDIERYLIRELSSIQQKLNEREQQNEKLRGEVESLKNQVEFHSHSVPKAQYDEVLEQNKEIADNNAKLNHQNEELQKEADQQKKRVSDLGHQNGVLFGESLVLQQEIVNLKEQLKQQQQKQNKIRASEQNEKIKKLEANLVEEQQKVKSLEEKLSSAENCHKTQVEQMEDKLSKSNAQILVLNDKLKSSAENVDSFLVENQNLLKKIENFEAERKLFANEKEQINAKNHVELQKLLENSEKVQTEVQKKDECFNKLRREFNELKKYSESEYNRLNQQFINESESARKANAIAHEQDEKIKVLKTQFEELKSKSKRKSEFIAALKNLVAKTENDLKNAKFSANELKTQVNNLRIDKDYLSGQLNFKISEIKKLQSVSNSESKEQTRLHQIRKAICNKVKLSTEQQLQKQLEENATLLKAREQELKQEKLATALQKEMINASDAKAKELEEEVKELQNKVEKQKEFIRKKYKEFQFLKRDTQLQRERELEQKQVQEQQNQHQFALQNQALSEKETEIISLHETLTELKESLKKYKEESISNRKFIEKILAKKAQLKDKVRSLTLSSQFEPIEITCIDMDGKVFRKMPENDIHLRKLLKINTKKVPFIADFIRRKLDELQETNEGVVSLRGEISSLKNCLEEHKETINKLKRKLKENGMGHTDLCKELQRLRAENSRLEAAMNENFRVEEEVICSSEDEDSYKNPAKRARMSRVTYYLQEKVSPR